MIRMRIAQATAAPTLAFIAPPCTAGVAAAAPTGSVVPVAVPDSTGRR
ncbi:hypothetical protein [Streptomyces sp. NPDC002602]